MKRDFYINIRKRILENIEVDSLVILFSGRIIQKSADQDFPFEVNKNFYYCTGINQENVILALRKTKNDFKEVLFIEKNDPILVKWVGKKLEEDEAKHISGVEDVRYVEDFKDFLFNTFNSTRISSSAITKLYLDLEARNTENYTSLALEFSRKVRNDYPQLEIINLYNKIIEQRMIKYADEVEKIKESIIITKGGIESMMRNCKPGMYEYELEAHFNYHIYSNRQKRESFKTIAASGKNATILHYVDNNCVLKDNDLVLCDLGCCTNFYISDLTRTFPVNGRFTKRQKEVYQAVLNVNKICIDYLKAGITWKEFNTYANEQICLELKKLGLITDDKDRNKYYYHSIGHSIGLDTHDPSIYDMPFEEGMIVTVEPGIYIEEENIGIRIEDNILITKAGSINLSADVIKEISDIEKFMEK